MAKKPTKSAKRPKPTKPKPKLQSPTPQKLVRQPAKLSNSWRLAKASANLLWQHKELFAGIAVVYGLLNLLLVQGIAGNTDVSSLKEELNLVFTGHLGSLTSSLSIFALLVGSAGNSSSQTAGAYQFFLAIITSLAVIWALRQVLADVRPRLRDAFYHGMYPLIPFILVLIVIGLQLIPLIIGSTIYSLVMGNGIAVYFIEKLFWGLLFAGLAALSFYLISSSLFAIYIVTLPDMTPLKALRSARELVRSRRLAVLRKLLCLPLILIVAAAIIMVPIITLLTPLAQWIFFVLTTFGLVAMHTYMYTLYRELLNE